MYAILKLTGFGPVFVCIPKLRIQYAETLQRRPIFRNVITATLFLSVLRFYQRRNDFLLHAFCIMPDHYHLVMELGRIRSLSRILNNIHSAFVTSMDGKTERKTRYWSGNTWDVWIRNEEMYWQKVAYTLLIPGAQDS